MSTPLVALSTLSYIPLLLKSKMMAIAFAHPKKYACIAGYDSVWYAIYSGWIMWTPRKGGEEGFVLKVQWMFSREFMLTVP